MTPPVPYAYPFQELPDLFSLNALLQDRRLVATQKTILIVEDNEYDARLLEDGLRKAGVQQPIKVVRTGSEAIQYLKAAPHFGPKKEHALPAAIFLDLILPDMNGHEVLKWIAGQPQMRRVLVVVHSGFENVKEIEALYAAGANTFLSKSNERAELQNLIDCFPAHFERCAIV
jgi:CheY-like chemotaxis protein